MSIDQPPLRVATAGSVDDGKSTLIGRLLLDADALFVDQLSHVTDTSKKRGQEFADLSLITDGLRAEREQGITIDVAWRYATTPQRRLILADAPGHVQYTRNTVTAASTADVLVILVDVTRVTGALLPQTERHLSAGLFLGVPEIVVAVNKMDAVGFSHERFAEVRALVAAYVENHALSRGRPPTRRSYFPVSALAGDNVVKPSARMPWFDGSALLAHLESAPRIADPPDAAPDLVRFVVQRVVRPGAVQARGYSGRLVAGNLRVGQTLRLPSGMTSVLKSIATLDGPADAAHAGQSATLTLADELDISRGDVMVSTDDTTAWRREVTLDVAWVGRESVSAGTTLHLKHGAKKVRAVVERIDALYESSGENGERPAERLSLNDFGRVTLRTSEPLLWDPYQRLRATGRAILIGKESADTVAAALFLG